MHQIGAVHPTVAVRVPTGLRPAPEPRPPLPGWASATNLERRLLVFFSSPQNSLDPWAPESQVRLPHTTETCGRGGGCSGRAWDLTQARKSGRQTARAGHWQPQISTYIYRAVSVSNQCTGLYQYVGRPRRRIATRS